MYIEGEIPSVTTGYNNNGGFFGSDGIWAIILFAMIFNGGWGNGNFGGGSNFLYDVNANTNRGFDNLALNSGIDSLQTAVSNGFADAQVARCNSTTALLQAINGVQSAQQSCCCENRLATSDLKSTIIQENCQDREVISLALRDVIASNTANTQAILDKLCQQEIDAKNDQIATLRTQLNMSNLAASQTAQTADIINALRPVAQPAYITCSPFTSYANNGCGCGSIQ